MDSGITVKDKAPTMAAVKAAEKRLEEKIRKIKELQREINEDKATITRGRRAMDTKFSILIGRYIRSDLDRMTALLDSSQFQNYLNARDREFVRVSRAVLYPDLYSVGETSIQGEAESAEDTEGSSSSH